MPWLIKQSWPESGCVYGYRKNHDDSREPGENCGTGRVERITRENGIQAQVWYMKPKGFTGGTPAVVAPNHLERRFDVRRPDEVWVTDITMVRTREGWRYVAVYPARQTGTECVC